MHIAKLQFLRILAVASAIYGCAEPTTNVPASPPSETQESIAIPADYVSTPAGWYHRSCVHEVPNGARIERDGLVRRSDNSTYQISTMCAYPVSHAMHAGVSYQGEQHQGLRAAPTNPVANGWIEWAQMASANDFSSIVANWSVPTPPLAPYTLNETYYTFPGILSDSFIVQPVIQFGVSAAGGGNFWSMASWQCGPPGGCYHSPLKVISKGDMIHGSVASGCTGGVCVWSITTKDVTTGDTTNLSRIDSDNYQPAVGGSVEVYGVRSCDEIPINGVTFSGISLFFKNGTQASPVWQSIITPGVVPSCSYNVTTSSTSVSLFHNPNTTTVTAKGGLSASCGLCTSRIISVLASGNIIAVKDNGGHTGNIVLSGATATGGLTASCMLCNNVWINSLTASGHTITVKDAGGHTGTIVVSGSTLSSISGGLNANCGPLCANASIKSVVAIGANGITTVSDGTNNVPIKFH